MATNKNLAGVSLWGCVLFPVLEQYFSFLHCASVKVFFGNSLNRTGFCLQIKTLDQENYC